MTLCRRCCLLAAFLLSFAVAMVWYTMTHAHAQEIHHHEGQSAAVDKFYSTWYMPDQPSKSCCNKTDCYPTDIKYTGDLLYARRREDGRWLRVPEAKIERNRDNPDGRNHLCAPPPNTAQGDIVFCFSLGGGT